jgi:hypothetical protein
VQPLIGALGQTVAKLKEQSEALGTFFTELAEREL